MQRILATLAVLACAAAATTARAEPPGATPAAVPVPDGPRDEGTATGLSLLGTIAGPTLAYVAFHSENPGTPLLVTAGAVCVFGPSLGSWYAGKWMTRGLALRVLGGALFGGGIATAWDHPDTGGALAVVGLGMVVVSGVLDIQDAPLAARAYNRAHARTFAITPTFVRTTGRAQPGLAVAGTF